MAYLLRGVVYILWDNIPRGALIHCPHIEAACTSETKSDRNLGETRIVTAMATAIQMFTGNNTGPRGDLTSRSVKIEIEVNQVNPENRAFVHPAPIEWVEANRGKILVALYTLLIGTENMRAGGSNSAQAKGRFKDWWLLAGRPVEYAAGLAGYETDFGMLFLELEDDEEDQVTLAGALAALSGQWRCAREEDNAAHFTAKEVTELINSQFSGGDATKIEAGRELREFLFADLLDKNPNYVATSKAVGRRLVKHCGAPVSVEVNGTRAALSLRIRSRYQGTAHKGGVSYWLKIS
jgi:hypothetical protein